MRKMNREFLRERINSLYPDRKILEVSTLNDRPFPEALERIHEGTMSDLDRLDVLCKNGEGTFPLSLLCKQYHRADKGDLRDEVTLFQFYNRIFEGYGDRTPFPTILDHSLRQRALLREFVPGITLAEAFLHFHRLISNRRKDISRIPRNSPEGMVVRREYERLQRNKEILKKAVIGTLATIHHHGTENITQLQTSWTGFQRYKVDRPTVQYYVDDFADHFRNVLERMCSQEILPFSSKEVTDRKEAVSRAFADTPLAPYFEKADDTLILGDAHPENFIILGTCPLEEDPLYLGAEAQITPHSLTPRVKCIDLGKGRVGVAASDLADLLNYPGFIEGEVTGHDWSRRTHIDSYVEKKGSLEDRTLSYNEGIACHTGVHYFSIIRAMHAADVDERNSPYYLKILQREITSDRELLKLEEALSDLFVH